MVLGLFMMCFFGIQFSELNAKGYSHRSAKNSIAGPVANDHPSQSKAVLTEKHDDEESESDMTETAGIETAE